MSVIEPIDCLTALVVGFHYKKPRYSIANSFNEILDQVQDLPGFTVSSIDTHELIMKVGKIKVSLSHQNLIINSPIVIAEKLRSLIAKDVNGGKIPIPNIYGQLFALEESILVSKEGPKRFRDDFLADSIEMTRLLDKIVMGLPPLKFAGFVEYYAIPLNHVSWDILERFNREAYIPDGENTEKRSINRYYFPKTDKLDKRCLIFHLVRQNSHDAPDAVLAGASFDYQFIPEQEETKNLDGYGGAENLIKSLSTGMGQILTKSKFMSFSSRGENHVN